MVPNRPRQVLQFIDQARLDPLVEEGQILGAVLQSVDYQVPQKVLGQGAVVRPIGKGHFRLDHPELAGVAAGVGVFGAEGGAEGIDVREGGGEELPLELAADGEPGLLPEKVLPPIDWPPARGGSRGGRVVTRNISPAPSQSLAVMIGVWT